MLPGASRLLSAARTLFGWQARNMMLTVLRSWVLLVSIHSAHVQGAFSVHFDFNKVEKECMSSGHRAQLDSGTA